MEIKSLSEKKENSKLACLIMGEPGVGKTSFAGTFKGGILHFDLASDGGYVVYEREDTTDIVEIVRKDNVSIFKQLTENLNEIADNAEEYAKTYNNIVIDPVNAAYDDYLEWYELNFSSKDGFKKWADVGETIKEFRQAYARLKKDFNVIVLSHTAIKDMQDTFNGSATYQVLPALNEKNAKKLCSDMDLVAYIGIQRDNLTGKSKRALRCGLSPHYPTRQRFLPGANADGVDFTPHMGQFFMELKSTIKGDK